MPPRPAVLPLMLKPQIGRMALKVSLVEGAEFKVINKGGQFWTHHAVNHWQVAMKRVVPYYVSSYGAAPGEGQREQGR